jgi:hypothetical protein
VRIGEGAGAGEVGERGACGSVGTGDARVRVTIGAQVCQVIDAIVRASSLQKHRGFALDKVRGWERRALRRAEPREVGKRLGVRGVQDASEYALRVAEDDNSVDEDYPVFDDDTLITSAGVDKFVLCDAVSERPLLVVSIPMDRVNTRPYEAPRGADADTLPVSCSIIGDVGIRGSFQVILTAAPSSSKPGAPGSSAGSPAAGGGSAAATAPPLDGGSSFDVLPPVSSLPPARGRKASEPVHAAMVGFRPPDGVAPTDSGPA